MNRFMTRVLALAMFTASLALGQAHAAYPERPIRLIVGFSPGGNGDTFARQVAQDLTTRLGQTVVVENKPGAGGMVAARDVAGNPPDGYTLLWANSGNLSTAPAVYGDQLPYRVPQDFTFIGMVFQNPHGLFVAGDSRLRSFKDLYTYPPNKLTFASTGTGGASHIGMEAVKQLGKLQILHIPYRSAGPAITDMLGGRVDMLYTSIPAFHDQVESGQLRLLAVTGAERNPAFADVPTFKEQGVDAEIMQWFGIVGPAGLPADVARTLSRTLKLSLGDPRIKGLIEQGGGTVNAMTGEAFQRYVVDDIQRYQEAVSPELRKQILGK